MICNKSLEKLVVYYRIFNDYFGVPVDINTLRKIIHHLNLYFVKNYLHLVLAEHPIMIDDVDFDKIKSYVEENPVRIGSMPLSDSESCNWTVWEETSVAEREYFIQMMSMNWMDDDISKILIFDYQNLIEDKDQILYYHDNLFNMFLYECDMRYDDYTMELNSRKKIEIRNQLLNKLL